MSIEKIAQNQRLSILQWETLSATIANKINNMPLALRGICSNVENLDIITPNRLKMGRNNERNPTGPVRFVSPSQIIKDNEKFFDAWFENWLVSHVPRLLQQNKWFTSNEPMKKCDIVLFLKQDSKLLSEYQYGIVVDVELSRDGEVRKASVKYKNANERVFRETRRAARTLVVIHHVDELDIVTELNSIGSFIEKKYGNVGC